MNTVDPVQEYEDFMTSNVEQDSYVDPVIMKGYVQPNQEDAEELRATYMKNVRNEKFYDLYNFFTPLAIGLLTTVGLITTITNITSIF
jgi:hypothetical protein